MQNLMTHFSFMTPLRALELLEKNAVNRSFRPGIAALYAKDMKAGNWQPNGETIKISDSGRLLDGQHRLHAVVLADTAVPMLVAYNLSEDSFSTIDTGMRRTAGQIIQMSGEGNANVLASIARWIFLLENGTAINNQVSTRDLLSTIERHPLAKHYATLHCSIRHLLPSSSGAVFTIAAEKYSQSVIDEFIAQLTTGIGLSQGSPAYCLREAMIRNSNKSSRLKADVNVAYTIKAIKAHANNRTLYALRWNSNEGWPQI